MQTDRGEQAESCDLFVIKDKLRSGDVILTMGSEKFSGQITAVTEGSYSHAILVVSESEWFEADDAGVGYSTLIGNGGWLKGPGIHQRVLGLPQCSDAQVLSHPALAERFPADVEAAIAEIVEPWVGNDYSDYRRLYFPLTVTGQPKWWTKIGLAWRQWRERPRPSGMFCSEVVACVFESLERSHNFVGASLFAVSRRAELVHPGHLEHCRLEPVKDAVRHSSRLPRGMHVEWDPVRWDRRQPTRSARSDQKWKKYLADVDAQIAGQNAATLREQLLWAARSEHEIRNLLGTAGRLHAPETASKLVVLLQETKGYATGIENYFRAKSNDLADYFDLLKAQVEIMLSLQAANTDLLEECTSPDDPSIEQRRQMIAAARATLLRNRLRAQQVLEEIRQEFGV